MNEVVQYTLTGAIVALAVGYVLRRAWRLLRGKSLGKCGGCSKCSTSPVVSLESLTSSSAGAAHVRDSRQVPAELDADDPSAERLRSTS